MTGHFIRPLYNMSIKCWLIWLPVYQINLLHKFRCEILYFGFDFCLIILSHRSQRRNVVRRHITFHFNRPPPKQLSSIDQSVLPLSSPEGGRWSLQSVGGPLPHRQQRDGEILLLTSVGRGPSSSKGYLCL